MKTAPLPTRSERLAIGPAGLTRFNPENGHCFPVTGLKAYDKNGFIHFSTTLFPVTDDYLNSLDIATGERRTPKATAHLLDVLMHRLLGLLLLLLLVWCVACKTVRPETHDTSAEKATPAGRYEWHEADTATE